MQQTCSYLNVSKNFVTNTSNCPLSKDNWIKGRIFLIEFQIFCQLFACLFLKYFAAKFCEILTRVRKFVVKLSFVFRRVNREESRLTDTNLIRTSTWHGHPLDTNTHLIWTPPQYGHSLNTDTHLIRIPTYYLHPLETDTHLLQKLASFWSVARKRRENRRLTRNPCCIYRFASYLPVPSFSAFRAVINFAPPNNWRVLRGILKWNKFGFQHRLEFLDKIINNLSIWF